MRAPSDYYGIRRQRHVYVLTCNIFEQQIRLKPVLKFSRNKEIMSLLQTQKCEFILYYVIRQHIMSLSYSKLQHKLEKNTKIQH